MSKPPGTRRQRRSLSRLLARATVTAVVGCAVFAAGLGGGVAAVGHLERAGLMAPPARIVEARPSVVAAVPEAEPADEPTVAERAPEDPAPTVALARTDRLPELAAVAPPRTAPADPPEPTESADAPSEEPASTGNGEADVPRIPNWMLAAVPVPVPEDRPMVAIVIDDLAVNQRLSRRAIDLPAPLTMSFLPYGNNLNTLVAIARRRGHEIMVHLPMEPEDPEADPGPDALLSALDVEVIRDRLGRNLAAIDGYVGVNNHMGSRFSAWEPGMAAVIEELRRRGLIYLDSLTTPETVAPALASRLNVPYLARDIFLDYDGKAETVVRQLEKLERIATRRGYAIGIGHPYDSTLVEVERWLKTAAKRGFAVVPVSAIVRANFALRG